MSGFWDAVGRAALGLSGTAVPRPHSIFEPDGRSHPTEDIETSDTEVELEPAPKPAAMESIAPAPAAAGAPERPRNEHEAKTADEEHSDRQRQETQAAEARPLERSANPAPTAERALEPDDVAPSPTRTVERIEIHRFETTRVVDEPIPPAPEERGEQTAVASEALRHVSEASTRNDFIESVDEPVATQPVLAVVAEPRAVVTELPSPANEPPLIVEIDRIDIRIESHAALSPIVPRRREAGRVPSLDQYLETRSGAQR